MAIIMDGSGRWALKRGMARSQGHRAGVEAVKRAVEAAPELGVTTLTLHAFSSDNWQRPAYEVKSLFRIFEDYLRGQIETWIEEGVRLTVFGRRDRLPESLRSAIRKVELATRAGRGLRLRLAIDYSGRAAIVAAARDYGSSGGAGGFRHALANALGESEPAPDVDLVIRTGGEQRLSDFMLWECAYAELYFTPRLWPDFNAQDFSEAAHEFQFRDRRFGRIPEKVAV